jgi:hypothetical protein
MAARQTTALLRFAAISMMNYIADNALRILKKSRTFHILRRHVAQLQRKGFTLLRFGTTARRHSHYNSYRVNGGSKVAAA